MDLREKKVTVIGAKRSGLAVADLVERLKGRPRISECATAEALGGNLQQSLSRRNVAFELGGHTRRFIEESDLVVLSPGVRFDAPPVQWAKAKNIPVLGEIEFAWKFCTKPVIAVTGSNGKTTTVHLITQVLENAGKQVCLCGNVGTAFSQHVLNLKSKDYVVLEISSFQLESIIHFRPQVAVFLNFSQNHLDRHKDLEEYWAAKKRIFMNQTKDDFAILNDQDESVRSLVAQVHSRVSFFNSAQQIIETGINNPNHLAAVEVGRVLGVSLDSCKRTFAQFKGVEHRLEFVRTIEGVDYINDSKSTTAQATRWALERAYKPVILICGGRDKHMDFTVLQSLVRQKVKKMLVIGEAREKIKKSFQDVVDVEEVPDLSKAVWRAKEVGREGDAVILSPMCASFDMFTDYEHRGRRFKEIVRSL